MSQNLKHQKKKRMSQQKGTFIACLCGMIAVVVTACVLFVSPKIIEGSSGVVENYYADNDVDVNSGILVENSETDSSTSNTFSENMSVSTTDDIVSEDNISDANTKRVAFTFDSGPHTLGSKIADEFTKYDGHATFFVFGERIEDSWAESMKYAAQLGNEIGIYAYEYGVNFEKCSDRTYREHLNKTATAIKEATGEAPRLFRPVGGSIKEERVESCPYSVVIWSLSSDDWKYRGRTTEKEREKNIDSIVDNVLSNVKDGDVIAMQEIYENSYEALCIILKELDKQGYEFVTVSELFGDQLKTGVKNFRYTKES